MNIRERGVEPSVESPRDIAQAVRRGMKLRCPRCGRGAMFRKYLKVVDRCPVCGEELYHHRADDAPPYFTIVVVGHIVVPLVLVTEIRYHPPLWVHFTIWIPLVILLSLVLLPIVKGAIVGLQWATRMHGFGNADEDGSYPGDKDITFLSKD